MLRKMRRRPVQILDAVGDKTNGREARCAVGLKGPECHVPVGFDDPLRHLEQICLHARLHDFIIPRQAPTRTNKSLSRQPDMPMSDSF